MKIIKYIGDFVGTLCHFVSIFSPASTELVAAGFVEKVVDFYGSTVTSLQKNWHSLKQRLTESVKKYLLRKEGGGGGNKSYIRGPN